MSRWGFSDDAAAPALLGVERSVSGRHWRARLGLAGETVAAALAERHGLPQILARVLAGRGVDADGVADWLEPTLKRLLPDPSTLTGMDDVAGRLADAVMAREAIALFGDYDVDGATSVAVMARYLRTFGLDPRIHIPDRLTEGYGPNAEAIAALRAEGARLLVTLDCGSTSLDVLGAATASGLDVLVIDHHQCGVELPDVQAMVNPNRQDDLSGQGHLCAAGVTFLVLVALNRELRRRGGLDGRPEPDLMALLDLVALGIVADVVPLIGVNRAFVRRGLDIARRRGNPGLAALAEVARLNGPLTPYHLGFVIGPRINAGGRIGDAGLGARLLTSDDSLEAGRLAARLDQLNRERQAIEAAMLAEAMADVDAAGDPGAVIVTASADWHPGIVGLIAARLKERWRRPAFAIALGSDDHGVGSGRSVAGVDLGAAVRAAVAAGVALKGGGHAMAAGVTIRAGDVDRLRGWLADRLAASTAAATAEHALEIDGVLTAGGTTVGLVQQLERAGPFGAGNPEPTFAFPAHRIVFVDRAGERHLRLTAESGDGSRLRGIAFGVLGTPLGEALLAGRGRSVHLAGHLSIDHFRSDASVQLRVTDLAEPGKSA